MVCSKAAAHFVCAAAEGEFPCPGQQDAAGRAHRHCHAGGDHTVCKLPRCMNLAVRRINGAIGFGQAAADERCKAKTLIPGLQRLNAQLA